MRGNIDNQKKNVSRYAAWIERHLRRERRRYYLHFAVPGYAGAALVVQFGIVSSAFPAYKNVRRAHLCGLLFDGESEPRTLSEKPGSSRIFTLS